MGKKQRDIVLGLSENLGQFSLLVLITGFVGSMVGLERTVVPLIGESEFGLTSKTAIGSFIVSFGVVKAFCNMYSARISEKWGRKKVLILGWIIGIPVPFIIIYANKWIWIDFANVLLGINQALTWSMTVIMKVDLVGPKRRGLALGLNEFAGYLSVGIMAWATGSIAATYSLRPHPFYLGVAIALAGFFLSLLFAKETLEYAHLEANLHAKENPGESGGYNEEGIQEPSFKDIFLLTSWKNRTLFSCSQAGLVNNLNDGMSWSLFPLFFSAHGLGVAAIGVIKAVYPGVWGLLQPVTGPLSDRLGRKWLIAGGMVIQAGGILLTVLKRDYTYWIVAALLQGLGTAMVYPVLLAAISDVAHPKWRASSIGVYRFWRDLGYAIGALLSGVIADFFGIAAAIAAISGLTFLSGLIVTFSMKETLPGKS
jgi:MFS family permease